MVTEREERGEVRIKESAYSSSDHIQSMEE
jgi:hypothetical protein